MGNHKHIAALTGLLALAIWSAPIPLTFAAPQERHFDVEASQFQFTLSTITVNPGDKVTIDLKAMDVVHGLYVDDYGLNVTADPGQTARFIGDKAQPGRLDGAGTCLALPNGAGRLT